MKIKIIKQIFISDISFIRKKLNLFFFYLFNSEFIILEYNSCN